MSTTQELEPSLRRHPRRRALNTTPPSLLNSTPDHTEASESHPLSLRLRKGETFHASKKRPSTRDPQLSLPFLPRRSPTSPAALEAVTAGKQRMSEILGTLDLDSFSASESTASLKNELPIPRGVVNLHIEAEAARKDSKAQSKQPSPSKKVARSVQEVNHHDSDSGLGTSICSSISTMSSVRTSTLGRLVLTGAPAPKHEMSTSAREVIEGRLLFNLLNEECYDKFHFRVRSVSKKIRKQQLCCLRDVEKALLLPPSNAGQSLARSFRAFGERVVTLMVETAPRLSGRDLSIPPDAPYSNSYFVDLYSQISRFCALRNQARSNQQDGEKNHNLRISVKGGLAETGRPVELVAEKDGQMISMKTGQLYDEYATPSMKRALSLGAVDEGARRSMARRKKDEPIMDIQAKCPYCDKIFRRPCDLTKHEKTHIRPFKCEIRECKYHHRGFPTQKELERHFNDRHDSNAPLLECEFENCGYTSKRRSNLNQHMEKLHDWKYNRTRTNGKRPSAQNTPETVDLPTPNSGPSREYATPITNLTPSPNVPSATLAMGASFSFADPPIPTPMGDFQLFNSGAPLGGSPGGFPDLTNLPHMPSYDPNFDMGQGQLHLPAGSSQNTTPISAQTVFQPLTPNTGTAPSPHHIEFFTDNSAYTFPEVSYEEPKDDESLAFVNNFSEAMYNDPSDPVFNIFGATDNMSFGDFQPSATDNDALSGLYLPLPSEDMELFGGQPFDDSEILQRQAY
ncbi:copper-binding transcription factor [Aspergillus nanangensis]|uniref:Copper-binding transcription factor n=1 Tax=Aspergillus nanangensis TaxID=2582783 RepID=A0AAD4CUA7_ASPNN|nr:copper-binding transcription factor [Aspergillus nanangensis]